MSISKDYEHSKPDASQVEQPQFEKLQGQNKVISRIISDVPKIHTTPPLQKIDASHPPVHNIPIGFLQKTVQSEPLPPPKESLENVKLNKGANCFPWNGENLKIGQQLLFNIQGDEFGENSELEGASIPEVLDYTITFMRFMQSQGRTYGLDNDKMTSLIEQLKQTHALAKLPKENFADFASKFIAQAIQNKQPFLIPGGWTGNPGHAIYYEVIPSASGDTASLRIFQLGKGSDEHLGCVIGNKIKRQAFYQINDIPCDNLLKNGFLEAVSEMRFCKEIPGTTEKTSYDAPDVYKGLVALVGGTIELQQMTEDASAFMTTQRAGTCPFRSLMAWMKMQMADQYKLFKCDIQLQSLMDLVYNDKRPTSDISFAEWNLVQKSLEKLSRHLNQAHEDQVIDIDYLNNAKKLLTPVKLWVVRHQEIMFREKKQEASIVREFPVVTASDVIYQPAVPLQLQIQNTAVPFACPSCGNMEKFRSITFADSTQAVGSLQTMLSIMKEAQTQHAYTTLQEGALLLAKKLPFDPVFWQKVPEQQKAYALVLLGQISQVYFQNCFKTVEGTSAKIEPLYVLAKILHIQKNLLPPEYAVAALNLAKIVNFEDLFFGIADNQIQCEMALMDFGKPFQENSTQASIGYASDNGPKLVTSGKCNNFLVYRFLNERDPSTLEKINAGIPNWQKLPDEEYFACFYTSPHLPEWARALRDTSLAIGYLATESIQPSTVTDFTFAQPTKQISFLPNSPMECAVTLKGANVGNRILQSDRYKLLYRPLKNQLQNLDSKSFLTQLLEPRPSEKDILNKTAKEAAFPLTDEEYHELAHIFCRKELQVFEAIDYFSNHPTKLQEQDYQVFLQMMLFNINALQFALNSELYANKIAGFISKYYTFFKDKGDLPTASFLLTVARKCSSFMLKESFFTSTIHQARELLSSTTDPYIRSLLYREIAASLYEKESLNVNEVQELLIATTYLQANPVPAQWADPSSDSSARNALFKHSDKIKAVLEQENGQILNAIFKTIHPDEEAPKWQVHPSSGNFPIFCSPDMSYAISPLAGQIYSKSQPALTLPYEMTSHHLFQKLFPGIHTGVPLGNGIYIFTDSNEIKTLVKMDAQNNTVIIEQERGKEWYRFIPPENLMCSTQKGDVYSIFSNRTLAQNYNAWKSISNPQIIFLCDRATQAPLYQAYFDILANLQGVVRLSDKSRLGNTPPHLFQIEDPTYIQTWYNEKGEMVEVVLPRFGLTFKNDPKNPGTLISDEFKDYKLMVGAAVKAFGSFTRYLVLQNGEHIKVIMPKQKFLAPKMQKMEVLDCRHSVEQNLKKDDSTPQKYAVFDSKVNQLGKVEWLSSTEEDRLYLSMVQTLSQRYSEAIETLQRGGDKRGAYTSAEKILLEQFISLEEVSGDNCGNAFALRTYAGYLLCHNALSYQDQVSDEVLKAIRKNYINYLGHQKHITIPPLEIYQELTLLKTLLQQEWDPRLFNRLLELDSEAAKNVELARKSTPPERKEQAKVTPKATIEVIGSFTPLLSDNFEVEKHSRIMTRPSTHIQKYFGHYFNVAVTGQPLADREWLAKAIQFSTAARSEWEGDMLDCLKVVLKNPGSFQPIYQWDQPNKQTIAKVIEALKVKEYQGINTDTLEVRNTGPKKYASNARQVTAFPKLTFDPLEPLIFSKIITVTESKKVENQSSTICSLLKSQISAESDPLLAREVERLLQDFEALGGKSLSLSYELKEIFKSIIKEIPLQSTEIDNEIEKLKIELVDLANSPSADYEKETKKGIQLFGERLRPVTLEDLLLSFGNQDVSKLIELNPHLNEKQLDIILNKVGIFLELATRKQHIARIIDSLKLISESEPQKQEELIQSLADQCAAQRCYDSRQCPAYLVFEYFAGFYMRQDQCEKLKDFLAGGNLNLVKAMIMGSGKSTVLLPLLALLRADGKAISTLIVPESLLEDVASHSFQTLAPFGQAVHFLHFDRNTVFTETSLSAILAELKKIQAGKDCLIMTQKSIQSFMLKFIEANILDAKKQRKTLEISPELTLMKEILSLIGDQTLSMIDEADSVLNVLFQICYGVGDQSELHQWEIALISEIYGSLYEDPEIKKLASLESDTNCHPLAPVLTEKLYREELQKPLAEKLIERLKTMECEPPEVQERVRHFFSNLTENNKKLVIDYLCWSKDNRENAQSFFNDLADEAIQNLLALAAQEISAFIPHTLCRISDQNYGLDSSEELPLPIPFGAVNKPNLHSQFANEYITVNYTFQIYRKKKVSKELVVQQLKTLKEQIALESRGTHSAEELKKTKGWKAFEILRGASNFPLENYTEEQLETLVKEINDNPAHLRRLISAQILPQLKLPNTLLSCNALNLIEFLMKPAGFSGTLMSSKSMHRKLAIQPEQGIDAKTIEILARNSMNSVVVIKEGDTASLIKQMNAQKQNWHVISDSGGLFKGEDNASIARTIARITGKEVVYYNAKGKQMITNGNQDIPLKNSKTEPKDRLTFLDQIHATGADVKQDPFAEGFVSIGKDTTLRDVLQSAWRLRALDKSQKVTFLLSDQVEKLIRQRLSIPAETSISFESILLFAIFNQTDQQGKDNFKSLCMELKCIPQVLLVKALMNPKLSPKGLQALQEHVEHLWLIPNRIAPKDRYGQIPKEEKVTELVEGEKTQALAALKALFTACPELEELGYSHKIYQGEVDKVVKKMEGYLPKMMQTGSKDEERTVEIQTQQETNRESQSELESQHMNERSKTKLGETQHYQQGLIEVQEVTKEIYEKFSRCAAMTLPLINIFANDPALQPYQKVFSDLSVSLNNLQWTEETVTGNNLKLFGPQRTPIHYIALDPNSGKVCLISQREAIKLPPNIPRFHITQGPVQCMQNEYLQVNEMFTKKYFSQLVQAKFLSGESFYNEKEIEFLKIWFAQHGKENMKKIFLEHILKDNPKKASYSTGNLSKLFE